MLSSKEVVRTRSIRNIFDSHPLIASGHRGVSLEALFDWYRKAFPTEDLYHILGPLVEKKQLVVIEKRPGRFMLYLPHRLPRKYRRRRIWSR